MTKIQTTTLRLTPEQRAKLQRLADAQDRSIGWVIRKLIDEAPELDAELNAVVERHGKALKALADK